MSSGFIWVTGDYAALSTDDVYAILQLRQDVFVVEQECCYADIDGFDNRATHMLISETGGALIGCQRVFAPGIWCDEAAISRILIARNHRGSGLGEQLVRRGVDYCCERYPGAGIRIGAQAHLESFYGRNGFHSAGNARDVDGIPHIDMLWRDQ